MLDVLRSQVVCEARLTKGVNIILVLFIRVMTQLTCKAPPIIFIVYTALLFVSFGQIFRQLLLISKLNLSLIYTYRSSYNYIFIVIFLKAIFISIVGFAN